jgi:hypothetical protein
MFCPLSHGFNSDCPDVVDMLTYNTSLLEIKKLSMVTEAFMRYWSGLYPEVTKEVIEKGVNLMLQTAIRLLGKKAKAIGVVLAIEDKKTSNPDDDEAE